MGQESSTLLCLRSRESIRGLDRENLTIFDILLVTGEYRNQFIRKLVSKHNQLTNRRFLTFFADLKSMNVSVKGDVLFASNHGI